MDRTRLDPVVDRPVVIIGAPRSGTTILARCLAAHRDVWHLPGESHRVLEGPLHPFRYGFGSNRVAAGDVDEGVVRSLREAFRRGSVNLNAVLSDPSALLSGTGLARRAVNKGLVAAAGALSRLRRPDRIRFVEKTPKNSLRVSLMDRLFPDAHFVWVQRRPASNVRSIARGWHAVDRIGPFRRERFAAAGYRIADRLALRDYEGEKWCFALIPGWQELAGASVAEVAVRQYESCNRMALEDFRALDPRRVTVVDHEAFVREPTAHLRSLFVRADLPPCDTALRYAAALPRVNVVREGRPDGTDAGVREALAARPGVEALWREMAEARSSFPEAGA